MIQNILLFAFGAILGAAFGIFLVAMLSANKQEDITHEKLERYKEGYQKGFDDGYELKKSHLK